MLTPPQIRAIYTAHEAYWRDRREEMRLLKSFYMTDFWRNMGAQTGMQALWDWRTSGRTERPKGFKVVESHVGSLFAKNPAVKVGPDLRARGNPEVAEATANLWLEDTFEGFENLTRLALIFPCSFLKLAPVPSPDPLKRVDASPVPPWEIVVDEGAPTWEQQRWVGHCYQMPIEEAIERYRHKRASYQIQRRREYTDTSGQESPDDRPQEAGALEVIRVLELYDLVADKLLVWSPDYKGGDDYLFRGVRVEVGALDPDAGPGTPEQEVTPLEGVEYSGIPYKSASGRPLPPIIPMYLARDPEIPLRGYSLLYRLRDLLREDAVNATRLSQGVRKSARQLLAPAGALDEQAQAKIAQGIYGEIIEVDVPPGVDPAAMIAPIQWPPTPAECWDYNMQVSADIDDAGLLAPFTRGEATGTTATEQTLLASYTASDLGRMARVRDQVIAQAARTYNVMLAVALGDDVEPLVLPPPAGQVLLSAEDITGDFRYMAVDGGSTPLSDAAQKAELMGLIPLLQALGVPAAALVAHIVRVWGLPEEFTPAAAPADPGLGAVPGAAAPALPGEMLP
jgi:hypothetical protein